MSHQKVLKRIYTIPFYPKLNSIPRTKRATRAMRLLREYIARHMKSEDILIDPAVNEYILKRGMQKPPRKITVMAEKSDDDVIEVYMVDTRLDDLLEAPEVPVSAEPSEVTVDEEEFEDESED